MIKVLFICHGNICRSPMAEFIMKDMVDKRGLSAEFYIESAATSTEELGNPVYPPAQRELAKHGISCAGKTARQVRKADYDRFDYIIAMETRNVNRLLAIFGGDSEQKISRLLEFSDNPGDIADPWYTGDFDTTYREVVEGCEGILRRLGL